MRMKLLIAAAGLAHTAEIRTIRWGSGDEPGSVQVKAGRPVCLVFDRRDGARAGDTVAIPALGMLSTLLPFASSHVDLGPLAAGRYEFRSTQGDLRGWLIVVP